MWLQPKYHGMADFTCRVGQREPRPRLRLGQRALAGRLGWLGGRPEDLAAFGLEHLKKEGFSLIWNTCVEIWPIAMANDGVFTIHLATKGAMGWAQFSPTYRHLVNHFLHALLGTMLTHQQFELESILFAMAMWLQPNSMVWWISLVLGLQRRETGHGYIPLPFTGLETGRSGVPTQLLLYWGVQSREE